MSDSAQPHRWQPTRLPCPWDSHALKSSSFHFLQFRDISQLPWSPSVWTFWASVLPSQSPPSLHPSTSACVYLLLIKLAEIRLFSCLFVVINILTKNTSITIATGSNGKHFQKKAIQWHEDVKPRMLLNVFSCCGNAGTRGLKLHREKLCYSWWFPFVHESFAVYGLLFYLLCLLLIEINSSLISPLHLEKGIDSAVCPLLWRTKISIWGRSILGTELS